MANDDFDLPRPTDAVPSATSAVINDDAKVLDYVINGTGTVTTRTGKQIMTIDQAIQGAAPVPLNGGVWASGQTFEFYNQYMYYDGLAYAALPATPLPYTVGAAPDLGFVYQIKLNSHQLLSGKDDAGGHDAIYSRGFGNVGLMLSYSGLVSGVKYSTGSTLWEYGGFTDGTINDFTPIGVVHADDFIRGEAGDPTPQFQMASDAAIGTLIIPPKAVVVDEIFIGDNVDEVIARGAILTNASPAGARGILHLTSSNSLIIDGGEYVSAGSTGYLIGSFDSPDRKNITIKNTVQKGGEYCTNIGAADGLLVTRNEFSLSSKGGVKSNESSNSKVTWNKFKGEGSRDYMLTAVLMQATNGATCKNNKIMFNEISDTGDTSIFARAFVGGSQINTVVAFNVIERAGKSGIKVSIPAGNDNATVSGCDVSHNIIRGYSVFVSGTGIGVFRSSANPTSLIEKSSICNNIVDGLDTSGVSVGLTGAQPFALWSAYSKGLTMNDNQSINAYGAGLYLEGLTDASVARGNVIVNSQVNATSYVKTTAAAVAFACDGLVFDNSITGCNLNNGVYVRSCTDSKFGGTSLGADVDGLYIDWVGSSRSTGLTFDMTVTGSGGLDISRDTATGAPILERCDWSRCVVSDGGLLIGNTARRDQYFSGTLQYGVTYTNTETSTIDTLVASGTWLSAAVA